MSTSERRPVVVGRVQGWVDGDLDSAADVINRELSWLSFARRVLALAPGLRGTDPRPAGGILGTYEEDNCSAWDMQPDGEYLLRHPAAGESRRGAHELFIERAASLLRLR